MKKNIIIAILALFAATFAPISAMYISKLTKTAKRSCVRNYAAIGNNVAEETRLKSCIYRFLYGQGYTENKRKPARKEIENTWNDHGHVPSIYKKLANDAQPIVNQTAVIENPADLAAFEVKKESVTEEQKPAKEKRKRRKNSELAGL
jgi:hypothetical protein